MNIIMIGPQGSGKGTQSDKLSAYLKIPTIAVGVLFRAEIRRGTGLGKAITEYVEKGDIVPPDIVNTVMHERLQEEDTAKGMIVDGYPRTEDQAVELDKILAEIGKAVTFVHPRTTHRVTFSCKTPAEFYRRVDMYPDA